MEQDLLFSLVDNEESYWAEASRWQNTTGAEHTSRARAELTQLHIEHMLDTFTLSANQSTPGHEEFVIIWADAYRDEAETCLQLT